MTVENQTNKTAAQVMGSYNYDFLFTVLSEDPTEEDAKEAVKVLISDGTTTQNLTYGTDYTVTLNENGTGGRVTVLDRKTSDWTLIVYREYGYTQGSDYNNYNAFPAETLERNLDKLTMITQQLSEESSRSVKVGMFSDATPAEMTGMIEDLWEIKDDMTTDAANISAITTTAGSIANVNAVAGSIANVNAVAENETNINAAVANATNINAAVANESNINTAVSNMAAIIDAPNQASAAAASAASAEDWATKIDGPVEGAEYSAKWYALNTDASGKADKDLSNLSATGQAVIDGKADKDLSNLSAAGQAILNGKADINLSNLNNTGNAAASNLNYKGIRTVIETYQNGNNWYRVWSDGWIEQGGQVTPASPSVAYTVNFLKPFAVGCKTMGIQNSTYAAIGAANNGIWALSTTQFQYDVGANAGYPFFWNAEGY